MSKGGPRVKSRPTIVRSHTIAAVIPRSESGARWNGEPHGLIGSRLPAFQSNGGMRGHIARTYPHSFEVTLPDVQGELKRISIVGVLALFATPDEESPGTFGATIHGYKDRGIVFRQDLLNGRCYGDATDLRPVHRSNGDGTSLETVGEVDLESGRARVDILSLDLPEGADVRRLLFKDLGSPASFLVFDLFLEYQLSAGCPFRSRPGNVSLSELGAIVRVRDRVLFRKALSQLDCSIEKALDLDEARGQCLTFLTVVTAATLEMGAPRSMVRFSLDAARKLDHAATKEEVVAQTHSLIEEVTGGLMVQDDSPTTQLVDRALALVERNFAREITDATVAQNLNLSTSHFRHLFKEATGQPFHKHLIGVRLERAKRLLMDGDLGVSEVAEAVGFGGLSHFSRAFSSRFKSSPTSFRRPGAGRSDQ